MLHISPGVTAYLVIVTLLLGLCAGSFANCAAWRAVHGEGMLRGRSHCPHCGHTLGPGELIPLVSWLLQKGRCRACGVKISPRYPIAEAICALAFLSALLRLDVTPALVEYCILATLLLAISLADWEDQLIPDRFLVLGGLNALVFAAGLSSSPIRALLHALLGGLVIALPLLLLVLLADKITGRETMGGGDIKLLFMLGLYFPWQASLLIVLLSCFLGLGLAAALGKTRRETIPFGPSLCLAAWLVFLWGRPVISWYVSFFV